MSTSSAHTVHWKIILNLIRKAMKYYINFRYGNEPIETLEDAEDYKTARYYLQEERLAYGNCPEARVWISTRATKDWYAKQKKV